ncbi:MAG: hypothetical protein ACD_17C00309G0003 [uncultured bacterium]|nr:MAG: hypothetical protein ACD_17C00309G0003 [uncultured bacterium]OGN55261.1 MAG: methionine ABC transporter permease [Chlamydiae bacterium RIFCSPHIGHO2_01_FULL_44_39]OGN58546.1 MAG: methionine ABC transporter permease [Chlamydiae bacterium RIFCSPHIGHO2_02_FULL_45_9]OGN59776.1 MAG: methionine ABC transporter permease [Chlamydiae bacterium RIFCSPHIGHO2_12_FULL_44_59]OGN65874.1 MAG: methionine ABC transporter permease [Chlamydiae bacterium RIFCSPLOWO2_01_FULL_44_52]OGN68284.1 MAG: methionine 
MENNWLLALDLVPIETLRTVYMVLFSSLFAILIGVPIGILLMLTDRGGLKPSPLVYKSLSVLVNIGRSFPFAILIVALIPFTRIIVGTSLGTTASIVPLTIAAIPFIARLIEANLKEIDVPIIEALVVMGTPLSRLIISLLLEALPSIMASITLMVINLVGYSAMAGLVGGGGLGEVAIQYGYNRFNTFIMTVTVLVLIALVQGIQYLGNWAVKKIQKKRGLLRDCF